MLLTVLDSPFQHVWEGAVPAHLKEFWYVISSDMLLKFEIKVSDLRAFSSIVIKAYMVLIMDTEQLMVEHWVLDLFRLWGSHV